MESRSTNMVLTESRNSAIPTGHASVYECYIASGKGAFLYDVEGREFIDFVGGIGVMNVGHSHPTVVAAIKDQAEKLTHTCFMVTPYEPAVSLAERLGAVTPGDFPKSTLFVNSGAEAVENAVKIARYHTKKAGIIAFENAFHGRTLLTMTLTSKVKPYKFGFGPLASDVHRMPYAYCYRCPFDRKYPQCDVACAEYLKDFFITHIAPESIAAVIVEPVQGEGGFITPPLGYFSKLASICKDNDILFVADEIQSGMGRTGKMFAIEHWKVDPDLTIVAKSFAAGMPLAAVVGKKEVMDSVHPGGIGGTYGGNPICCRAGLAVMEIFDEENLLNKAEILGKKLRDRFDAWKAQFEIIGDVRGIGPMMALELVKDREKKTPAADETKALLKFCFEKGLVLLSCGTFGNVIRVLMPLVIGDDELERGLAIMEEGFAVVSEQ
ncbi:MAG TPA: 4-aminobutyrate--2-oxoglutarate transaminase [Desulfobacterales bacterium]|nr:4-aminobutyrate--2-oxoglutarate transaminase [Desulfobacterales bacterium]